MSLQINKRYSIYPIQHHDIFSFYKKMLASFWTVEEVDLSKDKADWSKLDKDTKYFIENILAFFAGSDGIIMINLMQNFTQEIDIPEVNLAYSFQCMIEGIHSEMYSLMIDTYIKDLEHKNKLFDAINQIPCVKKKAEWALKWINKDDKFEKRLIAFAIVEGLFFSGSFCAIYWLKQKGIMPGLTLSNEFIARDEGMHTEFACMLYNKFYDKIDEKLVYELFNEAVEIETEFIISSLPCKLIGMNSELMSQYIKYVADNLLTSLEYNKLYKVKNPFPFMEHISVETKNNFFEHRGSSYQKAMVNNNDSQPIINEYNLESDF